MKLRTTTTLLLCILATGSAQASFDLGLSSASYLGQGQENRLKNYSSFTAGLDAASSSPLFVGHATAQGLLSFNDSNYRFVEAPEIYVGTNPNLISSGRTRSMRSAPNHLQFTLGRKLERWNSLDQHWGLGAWQPRFRWDYLSPMQVGIFGLQASGKAGPVSGALLYSPIFVPDRGAPVDFADGRMRSLSPWALNPPSRAKFRGRDTEVRYEPVIPNTMEVVKHQSVSAMARIGREQGLWTSAAVAYKPMNQLPMGYDGTILPEAVPYINVKIYPRVTYHTLVSLDNGWSDANWDLWTSFLVDMPNDDYVEVAERKNQNVSRMSLLSPTATYHFSRRSEHSGRVSASYLKRFGDDLPDTGIDATGKQMSDAKSAFDSRYPYAEAFLFGLRTPAIADFTLDSQMLLDVSHPGTILSWNVTYQPRPTWNLYVAADVLTSWSDSSPDTGTDFIYRYRANDRVMGGFKYVF